MSRMERDDLTIGSLGETESPSNAGLPSSSPGWTRTNNPPVNSRMLCQLSYRGTRSGGRMIATPRRTEGLRQLRDCVPDLDELSLQIGRFLETGARESPPQVPLAQAEEELLRRGLVNRLRRRDRVELGHRGPGLLPQQRLAQQPMLVVVEVLRRELLQRGEQLRKGE